jgi:hypothetical protein
MKMMTPVLTSPGVDANEKEIILPSEYWDYGRLTTAPRSPCQEVELHSSRKNQKNVMFVCLVDICIQEKNSETKEGFEGCPGERS